MHSLSYNDPMAVGAILTPILQKRKLRHQGAKAFLTLRASFLSYLVLGLIVILEGNNDFSSFYSLGRSRLMQLIQYLFQISEVVSHNAILCYSFDLLKNLMPL